MKENRLQVLDLNRKLIVDLLGEKLWTNTNFIMNGKQTTAALLVILAAVCAVNSQSNCPTYPPCSQVTINQPYIYPDFTDCNKYWVCQNRQATRMSCPNGMELDLRDFTCQTPSTQPMNARVTCSVLFTGLSGISG